MVSRVGKTIVVSSFPMIPLSPAWGLILNTAILGFVILKSCCKVLWRMFIFLWINSGVMALVTSLIGIWPVKSATLRLSVIKIISAFPSILLSKYSVCPGKLKFSDCMVFLLIGAVTKTSIFPLFRSFTASSSDKSAYFPAIFDAFPNSIGTSSFHTLIRLTLLGTLWSIEWIVWIGVFRFSLILCAAIVLLEA